MSKCPSGDPLVRQCIELCEEHGFIYARRTKHSYLYKHPDGGIVGIATSPGDRVRGLNQVRMDIRKALREHPPRP